MCFYMPQVAKGKAPHVWVINVSKVYWRNHVIKWVSYFHSTYLPTTAAWPSWVSKCYYNYSKYGTLNAFVIA